MSGGGEAHLSLRGRALRLEPRRPLLMGVLNASSESFYDGARPGGAEAKLDHGRALWAAGAGLIDVGGQSGVSDRAEVAPEEEAERVVPLVGRLAAEGATVSVDTWRADVARAAVAAGAALVNDVSGLSDPEVAAVCAEFGAGLVITHTRAAPKVKAYPRYEDVGDDIVAFISERMEAARREGVREAQLVVDPGPDLAKTPAETVAALRSLGRLRTLGRPVLLAVSRKDFVGAISDRTPAERLPGTLAAIAEGVDAGASILRVHDVAAVADFLAVRAALRGEDEVPAGLRLDERLRREESAA